MPAETALARTDGKRYSRAAWNRSKRASSNIRGGEAEMGGGMNTRRLGGLACLALAGVVLAQPAGRQQQQAPKPGAVIGRPVAVVNGVPITLAELEAGVRMAGPVPVHQTEAQRRQRQMEALARLIDNVLMRQYLKV